MKTGLVLEGGALRGLFSAGVTDVMMEHGIHFDGIIGVSAGACFGANIKSGQAGRSLRYNLRFAHDPRYQSLASLLATGNLFGARFAYHTVPDRLDIFDNQAFESNPVDFYLVCTDCKTGQPYYRRCDKGGSDLYEWIRASASMPLAAQPVKIGGQTLLDGGISDSIPLKYFQSIGYKRNVVILTQPLGYKKQPMKSMPIFRFALRHYPKVADALANRYIMYNNELDYIASQEQLGDTLIIAPKTTLPISRISHDRKKMRRTYDIGRSMAESLIGHIKNFLDHNDTTPHNP